MSDSVVEEGYVESVLESGGEQPYVDLAAVRRELVLRELARKSLFYFIRYTFPGYIPRPHNRLIADAIDLVIFGRWKRLMVFCPPQYGKSEIVSRRATPFILGNNPEVNIILASYAADLAHNFSREARGIIQSMLYKNVFGELRGEMEISEDAKSVKLWRIAGHNGGMLAAGVGGGITGHRADFLIIDDPVKDNEEASSERIRSSVWEWFWSSAHTRLSPNAGIVLCMTRWHEDDLAGRLLATQDESEEYWYVLRLPALAEDEKEIELWCERHNVDIQHHVTRGLVDYERAAIGLSVSPFSGKDTVFGVPELAYVPSGFVDPLGRAPGQPLDVTRHSAAELLKRANANPRVWTALWQQNPYTLGSGLIDVSRMIILPFSDIPPKEKMKILVRAWDFAFSSKEVSRLNPDYTVGALVGLWYNNGEYYQVLYEILRWRAPWSETKRRVFEIAQQDGPETVILIETGGAQKAIFEELRTAPQLSGFRLRGFTAVADKVARAQGWVSMLESGKFLVASGPWNTDFINECRVFGRGAHDDQIDACSLAYHFLYPHMHSSPVIRVKVRGLYK